MYKEFKNTYRCSKKSRNLEDNIQFSYSDKFEFRFWILTREGRGWGVHKVIRVKIWNSETMRDIWGHGWREYLDKQHLLSGEEVPCAVSCRGRPVPLPASACQGYGRTDVDNGCRSKSTQPRTGQCRSIHHFQITSLHHRQHFQTQKTHSHSYSSSNLLFSH